MDSPGVSLIISSRFFSKAATHVWARVHSFLLSDLSYFPNAALTLMSARMRGASAHARSHTRRRDSEIKLTAYT